VFEQRTGSKETDKIAHTRTQPIDHGVPTSVEKIIESQLRWFRHVQRDP
jgi:hypothetical protein